MNDTIIVKYEKDGEEVILTISRANILLGSRRNVKFLNAWDEFKDKGEMSEEDNIYATLKTRAFPDLTSAAIKATGTLTVPDGEGMKIIDFSKPLSFEDFLLIPDELRFKWENATYKLNPHWLPEITPEEAKAHKEKKTKRSTPG